MVLPCFSKSDAWNENHKGPRKEIGGLQWFKEAGMCGFSVVVTTLLWASLLSHVPSLVSHHAYPIFCLGGRQDSSPFSIYLWACSGLVLG